MGPVLTTVFHDRSVLQGLPRGYLLLLFPGYYTVRDTMDTIRWLTIA